MKKFLLIFMIIPLLTSIGCMNKSSNEVKQQNVDFITNTDHSNINQNISNKAKEVLIDHKEVTGATVVNDQNNIIAAIDVKPFSRFRLKKIEKKLEKELIKHFPKKTVTLSTDKKIMIELKKIEKSMQKQHVPKDQLKEKMSHIKKLSKEQT